MMTLMMTLMSGMMPVISGCSPAADRDKTGTRPVKTGPVV